MVVFISFLQSAKDGDGSLHVWLVYHDGLEASFKGFVFLKVLLILIEGGGTDRTEFTSRQSWLEDVGCIHSSAGLTCADEGVDFIDEEDDLSIALDNSLDNGLQSLLELALILSTCYEGTHIKRV